ncbi:MAG TPA: hypothetical protein PKC72_08860 [Chitinophagaceae bacterium]|nr:hypothetical protein [Chitinophagaceae bacterium]
MKTKTLVIIIMSAWLSGLLTCSIFRGDKKLRSVTGRYTPVKEVKDKVAEKEKAFYRKQDSLQNQTRQLEEYNNRLLVDLNRVKKENHKLKSDLKNRVEMTKPGISENQPTCDSLRIAAEKFIRSADIKDSLQEIIQSNLEQQLEAKNKMLQLKDEEYSSLKDHFNEIVVSGKKLEQDIKEMSVKLRRKTTAGKLLTIGGLVITAILINK